MSVRRQLLVERHDGVTLARLRGDIDLSNAEALEAALRDAGGLAPTIVVDLTGVGYMDSCGVRLLERLARAVSRAGNEMGLVVPPDSSAAEVLRVVGLLDVLEAYPTAAEALRALDTRA